MLIPPALSDADVAVLGAAVVAVTRELGQSMPAPKGAPYYGLDMTLTDLATLDAFSQHGIFRKYEHAVALGGAFGGALRWWAVRFGCTVVGMDERASIGRVAAELSARAGLGAQTRFVAGTPAAMPFRGGFTHAWGLDAGVADPDGILDEMFRALRPSGVLALYLGPERERDRGHWIERVQAAGFIGPTLREVPPAPLPQFVVLARRRLRADLDRHAPSLAAVVADQPLSSAPGAAALLFGQRPS